MKQTRRLPKLIIIVPCYNEEEALPFANDKLNDVLDSLCAKSLIDSESYILYVNDGSSDDTWKIIEQYYNEGQRVAGLKFAKNKGHQNALMAGLTYCKDKCDICVSIDADLQDDVNAIEKMVLKYHEGFHIVYGVRSERSSDSFFKRTTAQVFYKILKGLGAKTIYNHADFRLMSNDALKALEQYKEVNLFLRGMIPEIGLPSVTVEYPRGKRQQGESKYPLSKMISLALEGISSSGSKPMFAIISFGAIFAILGLMGIIVTLIYWIFANLSEYWLLFSFVSFMLGMAIAAIGYVGMNVSKNYMETKARPRYYIEKKLERK